MDYFSLVEVQTKLLEVIKKQDLQYKFQDLEVIDGRHGDRPFSISITLLTNKKEQTFSKTSFSKTSFKLPLEEIIEFIESFEL